MVTRIAVESDIERILELQSVNLYSNLSPAELEQGIVSHFLTQMINCKKNQLFF